jgi:adenylosuccinate synthase
MPTELFDAVGEGIRQRGREFGTTTGRPRRVGWLDLVALRYSAMINGTSGIAVMLLDVLAGVEVLNVCTHYEVAGERTDRFIPDAGELSKARPVYTSLPGFTAPIGTARNPADLPSEARAYVDFITESLGCPADFISVGPDREQTIRCRD